MYIVYVNVGIKLLNWIESCIIESHCIIVPATNNIFPYGKKEMPRNVDLQLYFTIDILSSTFFKDNNK